MRAGTIVIAVLLFLMGGVWIGQGLGYIKGSFMTGDPKWFWIGAALVAVALVLGGWAVFSRRGPRESRT
jgi:heme A synthase